jgi:hypothetical protein
MGAFVPLEGKFLLITLCTVVARETVFKSNLPNFNYDALCEDLENIIKSYENKDSGTCNMTESIVNEKVEQVSQRLFYHN